VYVPTMYIWYVIQQQQQKTSYDFFSNVIKNHIQISETNKTLRQNKVYKIWQV